DEPRGEVIDASDGYKVVGHHDGVALFTIGQRKGLGLFHSHLERYVIELRAATNQVVVGEKNLCQWPRLVAGRRNLLVADDAVPSRVMAQVRYRQTPEPASLRLLAIYRFELVFYGPQSIAAQVQSALKYEGEQLLGGDVIEERHRAITAGTV